MTDPLHAAAEPAVASTVDRETDATAAQAATPPTTTTTTAATTAAPTAAAAAAPASPPPSRRAVCAECRRPATVCLCPAFPPVPLRLRGACVVLQHPCEARRKLATVPLLRRAIDARDFSLVRGRRFDAESAAPALHALLRRARRCSAPVMVLWPRAGVSVGLGRAMQQEGGGGQGKQQQEEERGKEESAAAAEAAAAAAAAAAAEKDAPLAYLLIAIDGTWVQAQEMAGPLARWISKANGGPAVLVHLDAEGGDEAMDEAADAAAAAAAAAAAGDKTAAAAAAAAAAASAGGIPAVVGDPALRWRTEPLAAGMSTCEAVARALEVVEAHAAEAERRGETAGGDPAAGRAAGRPGAEAAWEGAALRAALVAPIARLVALQVKFDPSMRARTGQRPAEEEDEAAAAAAAAEDGQGGGGGGGVGSGEEGGEGTSNGVPNQPAGSGAYVRPSSRFRAGRREAKALRAAAAVEGGGVTSNGV